MALTLNPNPDPKPDPDLGTPGVWLFALGLFGAGVSSTLTVGLGTALAIEDILGLHVTAPAALATHDAASDACHRSSSSSAAEIRPATQPDDSGGGGGGGGAGGGGGGGGVLSRGRRRRRLRAWLVESMRWCRHGKACFYVPFFALGALPSLLRMNTISVIQLAQVINGCLLPNIAALLMIAVNDHALMRGKPQSSQLNVLMAPCAGMALFLASVVLLDQSVGRLAADWSGGRAMQVRVRVRVRVGVRVEVRGLGPVLGLGLGLGSWLALCPSTHLFHPHSARCADHAGRPRGVALCGASRAATAHRPRLHRRRLLLNEQGDGRRGSRGGGRGGEGGGRERECAAAARARDVRGARRRAAGRAGSRAWRA